MSAEQSPTALAAPIREVRDVDPDLTAFDVTTLDDMVAAAVMAAAWARRSSAFSGSSVSS